MRKVFFLFLVVGVVAPVFAQDSANTDSLSFECKVFYPETSEYPEVSVKSDTVKFRLFYVDDVCSGFTYRFSEKENTLLVQRTTTPPDTCTVNEQILYGVEGSITNVPKGKYLFELQTGAAGKKFESIFRDVVTIKK